MAPRLEVKIFRVHDSQFDVNRIKEVERGGLLQPLGNFWCPEDQAKCDMTSNQPVRNFDTGNHGKWTNEMILIIGNLRAKFSSKLSHKIEKRPHGLEMPTQGGN